jgi:hypothetical protein
MSKRASILIGILLLLGGIVSGFLLLIYTSLISHDLDWALILSIFCIAGGIIILVRGFNSKK